MPVAAATAATLFLAISGYVHFAARQRTAAGGDRNSSVKRAEVVEAVSKSLEDQLTLLVSAASVHLEKSNIRSDAFANAQAGLASANTVEKVQAIVDILISTSTSAQLETKDLRSKLNVARAQVVDIRQRLAASEKIAQLDGLTGLPNRCSFETALVTAVTEAHESLMPQCLVMADIDYFKKVNDTQGHPTGDAVLKQFSEVLAKNVRSTDIVARFGGEEFAVILRKTPMGNAVDIVERMRRSIQATKWLSAAGKDIGTLTSSFGIAEIKEAERPDALVERADRKLYAAKRNGRNRVEIDSWHQ